MLGAAPRAHISREEVPILYEPPSERERVRASEKEMKKQKRTEKPERVRVWVRGADARRR